MRYPLRYPLSAGHVPGLLALPALLAACTAGPVQQRADLLGTPIPASAAAHSVVITPDTRWVNVTGGDTVRFVAGAGEFGWDFHVSPLVQVFDLNRVAPPGLLQPPLPLGLPVYVDPDPNYSVGGDWRAPPR
jgi:hypothetical protein